jgi:hypothetical protein
MLAFLHSLVLLFASQFTSLYSTLSATPPSVPKISGNPPLIPDHASLQVTALVGQNNQSIFQCWKILPDYFISTTPGVVGARIQNLGDVVGASLVFFDPTNVTFAGLHPDPTPQCVF